MSFKPQLPSRGTETQRGLRPFLGETASVFWADLADGQGFISDEPQAQQKGGDHEEADRLLTIAQKELSRPFPALPR